MDIQLNEEYLKQIREIAEGFKNSGMPEEDLVQEGCLGFLAASESYDEKKDGEFGDYARRRIHQAISLSLAGQTGESRAPLHLAYVMNRVRDSRQEMAAKLKRKPTVEELAAELMLPIERVEEILRMSDHTELVSRSNAERSDQDTEPDSMQISSALILREQLSELLEDLEPIEQELITLRYGLGSDAPMDIDCVAEKMEIQAEEAARMEKKALEKLANSKNREKFKNYLE